CRLILRGHKSGVGSVAYSPDGTLLASGGHDSTVKVWDASTGQELASFFSNGLNPVAFSPDGKLLPIGSRPLLLSNVADRTARKTLPTNTVNRSVAWSPDSRVLAVGDQGTDGSTQADSSGFTLWDIATGQRIAYRSQSDGVPSVAFSPDGTMLASALW